MTNCLDCGYLHQHSMWNGEDKEYSKACRDRLLAAIAHNDEILQGIASGNPHIKHDPRYLCCHLNLLSFPGRSHSPPSGDAVSHNPHKQERRVSQMRQALEALTQDWECEYYTPHQLGFTPSEHLKTQAQRDWEEKQEQDRRIWEEKQEQERRTWEEKQRQRGICWTTVSALIALVVSSVVAIGIAYYQSQSRSITITATPTTTPTLTLTPTHAVTPTLTLTSINTLPSR